jgi:hypothetical protein
MGSFVEITLAFTFVADTPPEVLSAFAGGNALLSSREPAPELPGFDELLSEDEFLAEDFLGNWFESGPPPVADLPILHQAALWRYISEFGDNAYFAATPSTVLSWAYDRWRLTLRALPKESGEWAQAIIAPLGQWAIEGADDHRRFVGYLLDEDTPDPVLIWSAGRQPFQFTGEFRG